MSKKYVTKQDIEQAANGRWEAVLQRAGVPADLLNTRKHQPCPACGGTDRYRFTDHHGTGVWICNQCQPEGASPFDLVMAVFGCSFTDAKNLLADALGLSADTAPDMVAKDLPAPAKKTTARDEYTPIVPVPDFAVKSMNWHHKYRKDAPVDTSIFRNENGEILGGVARFIRLDGSKLDLPYTFCRHKKDGSMSWQYRCWDDPRPLFGLDTLAANPDKTVLIVEGEKCKKAADAADLGVVAVTWHGGVNNWDKADWTPIRNRRVILWADADSKREKLSKKERDAGVSPESKPYLPKHEQGGMKAMMGIAERLTAQGCDVCFVALPDVGVLPDGYDIADALTDRQPLLSVHDILGWQGAADWLVDYANMVRPTPTPPTNSASDSAVETAETTATAETDSDNGEDLYNQNFTELRSHFALVEGKESAVDKRSAITYSRRALIARFCKKSVESWFNWKRKPIWTQHEIKALKEVCELKNNKENKESPDVMTRYVYLDGSSSVWDDHLKRIIDQGAAKMAMGDSFRLWLNSPARKVIPLENIVFNPKDKDMGDNYINLFRGLPFEPQYALPLDEMPDYWGDVIALYPDCKNIYRLVKHLCNHDFLATQFVLNWLAYPLQNMGAKMATNLVVHGEIQGAGKSWLFDEIMPQIYGDYGGRYGQEDLESLYTANRSAKLYGVFEEVFNNQQKYNNTGKIKNMITRKTQRIERKFVDAYEEANYINCVFTSNEEQPYKLDENDRRAFVISPQQKLPEDLKVEINKEIHNGGIQAFYSLLMSLPMVLNYQYVQNPDTGLCDQVEFLDEPVPFHANTEAILTEAKRAVINFGRFGWQVFYHEWVTGQLGVPYCSCLTTDIYLLYKWWCRQSGEKELSRNKFLQHIATKMYRAVRWWRCPTSSTPDVKRQNPIFNPKDMVVPDGMAEMDYIGPQIVEFQTAVKRLIHAHDDNTPL